MLPPLAAVRSTDGFTFVELLVVTIVIALLAAIALPTFLRQPIVSRDAVAKSDAATLAGLMETCNATENDYAACDTEAELSEGTSTGLPWGAGAGRVLVTDATDSTYTVVAHSRSGTKFTFERLPSGQPSRTCNNDGHGGCATGGTW